MASGGNAGKSPVLNSSNSNDSGHLHSESSKDSKENLGKGSTEPPNPDPKQKNRLAQKRFRYSSSAEQVLLFHQSIFCTATTASPLRDWKEGKEQFGIHGGHTKVQARDKNGKKRWREEHD